MNARRAVSWMAVGLALCGCRPDLGDRESLITASRLLAVRGEPPEAKPGEQAQFDVLIASPDGTIANPAAGWAFCDRAKKLADSASVTADCLQDDAVVPITDSAATASAPLPSDGCTTFGPEVPSAGDRPHDADITGGYYQPVRVRFLGATSFGMERLSCGLADAPADAVKDYLARYAANRNPTIARLAATASGAGVALDAVRPGAEITFELSWAEGDAETYPVFDRETQALVDHRESMRVSWFATAGRFEDDRTGRDENDPATSTQNTWTAPDAGTVFLWAVLRDSRGGVAFTSLTASVAP